MRILATLSDTLSFHQRYHDSDGLIIFHWLIPLVDHTAGFSDAGGRILVQDFTNFVWFVASKSIP